MSAPRKRVATTDLEKYRLMARAAELELPAGSLGEPPSWFGTIALEEWQRLTTELWKILNPAHRSALIALCALTQREIESFTGAGTGKISASDRQTLHSLRMQFAVTPAAQTRVKLSGQRKSESKWGDTKPTLMSKTG